jgi:CBS-domain-containing membrane protein
MVQTHESVRAQSPDYKYAKEWLDLKEADVSHIMTSAKDLHSTATKDTSMLEIVKKLCEPGVRRVIILDGKNIVNMITQFYVLELLYKNIDNMDPKILSRTVKEFKSFKHFEILKAYKL